ncbi:MAG TPA: hypothetical protein VG268_04540 [Streptosporangiaceae bacterium]|jgi:energy-coupling factor transporter ATP-binding protein EcfA2|nr:hypothetical protein [Streptosporangiaceae bacterium]
MDTLVQLENVTKRYDGRSTPAVDDESLRIDVGHADAIAGPAPGSGKSTLLDLNAAGQTLIIVTRSAEMTRRHARRVIHLADGQVAPGPAGRGGGTEGA